jgi:cellulose synthase/poly-beta-1,6-N-acetylglucosamine synthase-like glycosyltransferase
VSSLATQLLLHVLRITFSAYAVLVITHFLLQTYFAHRTHRAFVRGGRTTPPPEFLPTVDVVVAAYDEDPADLIDCFDSLVHQDYGRPVNVYVVDDYSPNRAELAPVYERYGALPGWHVLLPDRNRGKRHAQDLAFQECRGEILVTIDSDTIVAPDGVGKIVEAFADDRVGAATGDVGVTNWRRNLLTRLIGMRYWVAFNQERAAQGWFRTVLCCSGPLAAYRRSVLERVWTDYIRQTFRGVSCTYGDDRHLTNLVLAEGADTVFVPGAKAITNAPESLRGYLKQQLRWNKSFYRELLWTLPFLLSRSRYMVFEVVVQTLLPLLLTLAIASAVLFAALFGPHHLLRYLVAVAVMALVRCSYAIYRTRRPSFALFVLYGFLHAALLIPLRLRALTTLTDNRWGTRTAV